MSEVFATQASAARPSMAAIAGQVAAEHDLSLSQLRTGRFKHWMAPARQRAMAEIYATGRFSNLQIARYFGVTNHATVVHARKRHLARLGQEGGAA